MAPHEPDRELTDIVQCPVTGCQELHSRSYLMCPSHWRRVRKATRERVWATYQKGQEWGKVHPSPDYLVAAGDALREAEESRSGRHRQR